MENRALVLGFILMLAANAAAEEYLQPKCQSILNNDLVNVIRVADVDRNGVPNVLVGTTVNGMLYNFVYKGADCTLDWTVLKSGGWSFNTRGDVKRWVISDIDGDGRNQIIINSVKSNHPRSTTPVEYLQVIQENGLEDWNFDRECGLTHSVDVADVNGDGAKDIVMGTQSKKVCAIRYDPKGKDYLHWSYEAKNPIYYVRSLDIDGDGGVETVALASKYMEAQVIALSKGGELLWENNIQNGVYMAMLPDNIIDVSDLDGDGKAEVVVGTYANGVDVYGSRGALKWNYGTGNPVTSILVSDLDGDGKTEILVGSAPKVIALDSAGVVESTWTAPVGSTIYSMSAADIDRDGRKEIALGTNKYIHVLDDDFTLKGSWRYTIEIQGLTKAFEERDANAVSVYMGDLDGDGEAEVAAAWNWEQSTVRGNEYSADIRVYEINRGYKPGAPTTTLAGGGPSDTTATTQPKSATTQPKSQITVQSQGETEGKGKGMCCIPLLPAVLALALAIAARIPLAAVKY